MMQGYSNNPGQRVNYDNYGQQYGGFNRYNYGHQGGYNRGSSFQRRDSSNWLYGNNNGNTNTGGFNVNNAQNQYNRRTSESGGGRRLTFNEEFDFETANNEFEHLKDKFSEVKIDNTEAAGETSASKGKYLYFLTNDPQTTDMNLGQAHCVAS
jgi:hypothetical protein